MYASHLASSFMFEIDQDRVHPSSLESPQHSSKFRLDKARASRGFILIQCIRVLPSSVTVEKLLVPSGMDSERCCYVKRSNDGSSPRSGTHIIAFVSSSETIGIARLCKGLHHLPQYN